MMNIIAGLILMALGVCIVLRPRTLLWFSWRWWLPDRELTRAEQLVAKVVGAVLAITGLALIQLNL